MAETPCRDCGRPLRSDNRSGACGYGGPRKKECRRIKAELAAAREKERKAGVAAERANARCIHNLVKGTCAICRTPAAAAGGETKFTPAICEALECLKPASVICGQCGDPLCAAHLPRVKHGCLTRPAPDPANTGARDVAARPPQRLATEDRPGALRSPSGTGVPGNAAQSRGGNGSSTRVEEAPAPRSDGATPASLPAMAAAAFKRAMGGEPDPGAASDAEVSAHLRRWLDEARRRLRRRLDELDGIRDAFFGGGDPGAAG